MKKNILMVMAILMAALIFVSCEPKAEAVVEEEPRDLVEVTMVTTQEKTLSSDINKDIVYWEFKATPKFTLANDEKIYGTVGYWRRLDALQTGADGVVKTTTSLGRYTSGDWLFQLRALNSEKHVVAVGSTQQILREGADNTVNITMYIDRGDGTQGESADRASAETGWDGKTEGSKTATTEATGRLHVGLVVNRMDADLQNMKIVAIYQKVNKNMTLSDVQQVQDAAMNWVVRNGGTAATTTTGAVEGAKYTNWYLNSTTTNYKTAAVEGDSTTSVEQGKVYYEGVLEGLSAGPYIFTFFVQGTNKAGDFINLGGQALDVVIVGGEETQVKGTLLANEYVLAGMQIKAPGTIFGSINGTNFIKASTGTKIALQFQQTDEQKNDSGEDATRYYWYVNSTQSTSTTNTFEFTCPTEDGGTEPAYGIYRVTCIPTGTLGSTGTVTVDVIFNPDTGANIGEFDWSNVVTP